MFITIIWLRGLWQEKYVQKLYKKDVIYVCSYNIWQKLDKYAKKHKNMYKYNLWIIVNKRTVLCSDVIRAWERRYGAVISQRTSTNRRLYSDSDIEKLSLLKRAVGSGRRIGDIANLSYDDLFELVMGDESNNSTTFSRPSTGTIME